jgi:hypothetical protein
MPFLVLFGINVEFGLAVWGVVAGHYIWPALRNRPGPENLKLILLLHGFRSLGLAFVAPGVVSPDLPAAFGQPVAYGDFISAMLALPALATLKTRTGTGPGRRTCSLLFTREAAYHSGIRQAC